MVTIITPVYNAERYLRQTADCVFKQTYKNYQWVLVDDGSSDASGVICDELANRDSRVNVLHQSNFGVSAARNAALKEAKGEWIVFLDADDEVKPEWLQNYIEAVKPNVDIVFQGAVIRSNNDEKYFQLENVSLSVSQFISLWQNKYHELGSAWCKMIRTSLIKDNDVQFQVGISNFEDWIFLTKCLCHASELYLISGIGYIYNHQNSFITAKNGNRRSAEKTYDIVKNWYVSMQPLKKECLDGYNMLLCKVSSLMIQTIIEFYRRNDIEQLQRIKLLNEFGTIDFVKTNLTFCQKITNMLWMRKHSLLTDFILQFWRLVNCIDKQK